MRWEKIRRRMSSQLQSAPPEKGTLNCHCEVPLRASPDRDDNALPIVAYASSFTSVLPDRFKFLAMRLVGLADKTSSSL